MQPLKHKSALVVEDEAIVAMMIEDALLDLGCNKIYIQANVEDALQKIASTPIDFAVLDVNLGGRLTYPVADLLIARGIQFIFATGYGMDGVGEAYKSVKTIQKPFASQTLQMAIEKLFPASGGRAGVARMN